MQPSHRLSPRPRFAQACTLAAWFATLSLLTACAQGPAGPAGSESLQDRRQAISQGTAPGIVFFTPGNRTGAASAPSGPGAQAPAAGHAAPVQARPPAVAAGTPPSTGFFGSLPPPSGRPINDAKKLNAPDQGIPVPTAGSASSAR
jgi:hypothetical protein